MGGEGVKVYMEVEGEVGRVVCYRSYHGKCVAEEIKCKRKGKGKGKGRGRGKGKGKGKGRGKGKGKAIPLHPSLVSFPSDSLDSNRQCVARDSSVRRALEESGGCGGHWASCRAANDCMADWRLGVLDTVHGTLCVCDRLKV